MGALRDAAKNNSNFLLLEKGHAVVVEYRGFQLVPNMRDPSKQSAVIEVLEMGRTKYWTTSNREIMFFFDDCPQGRLVRINRDKFLNKAGIEDPLKSSYSVELYYEPISVPVTQQTSQPAQSQSQVPVGQSSLADMQNFNPDPNASTGKDQAWQK